MSRYLAFAYMLTVAVIAASLAIARGSGPLLDGPDLLLVSQGILVALLPAAILAYRGTRRSSGGLRRALGYSLFAANLVFALSGALTAGLVLAGVVQVAN